MKTKPLSDGELAKTLGLMNEAVKAEIHIRECTLCGRITAIPLEYQECGSCRLGRYEERKRIKEHLTTLLEYRNFEAKEIQWYRDVCDGFK